ncbi:MAG: prepilin peptidase [Burkholderiales bacterium]|nr:prepilin peptidase [Burkholderiales bacterium]
MRLDVSPAVWQMWCLAALALTMLIAVEADLRQRRVPNVLVLLALGTGTALNVLGPANGGAGPFAYFPGALGAGGVLLGAITGLGLFLPWYLLRAMGAGDVKLMAAIGSFVGSVEALSLAVCILIAGGVLAAIRMLWLRQTRRVLANVMLALDSLSGFNGQRFDPVTQTADNMPYTLAIAGGLASYVYWRLAGGAPFVSV